MRFCPFYCRFSRAISTRKSGAFPLTFAFSCNLDRPSSLNFANAPFDRSRINGPSVQLLRQRHEFRLIDSCR